MQCKIKNYTKYDMSDVIDILKKFIPYAKKKMGFDKPVDVDLVSDPENGVDPLGKTAYYVPDEMKVVIYTDNRHPKDILRSVSHELMHHAQNCRGDFDKISSPMTLGYAQEDPHLRNMEKEAYEAAYIFRDFTDQHFGEGYQKKELNEWKTETLFDRLNSKWATGAEIEFVVENNLQKVSPISSQRRVIYERLKNAK